MQSAVMQIKTMHSQRLENGWIMSPHRAHCLCFLNLMLQEDRTV